MSIAPAAARPALVPNPKVTKATIEDGLRATARLQGPTGVADLANQLEAISAGLHAGTRTGIDPNELGSLRSQVARIETDQRSAASTYLSLFDPPKPGQKLPTGADGVNRTMNVFAEKGQLQPASAAGLGLLLLSNPKLGTASEALAQVDESVTLLRTSIPRTVQIERDLRAALETAP